MAQSKKHGWSNRESEDAVIERDGLEITEEQHAIRCEIRDGWSPQEERKRNPLMSREGEYELAEMKMAAPPPSLDAVQWLCGDG